MTSPGHIVLVGMPGSGKTTIGRKLARVLDLPFYDTDALVETTEGTSIPEIFASRGEAYFREREEAAVAHALASPEGVVSLGGGAILSARSRSALASHVVIHLTIGVAEGTRRSGGGGRPLLAGGDATARYQRLLTERAPLYKEVATLSATTERRSTGKVVRELVSSLRPELAEHVDDAEDPNETGREN